MGQFNTPVALIIFNRPDKTEKLFNIISSIKPRKLFIIADGPRKSVPGEKDVCAITRKIVKNVKWKCELFTNFSEENLGCGERPATGISWVFNNVDRAIILEDDCIPHPSFFPFCEELLERYKDDERIMMISGNNFQFGTRQIKYSYYFSIFTHIWGWATWKRAWEHYDYKISQWPEVRDKNLLENYFSDKKHISYWKSLFDNVYSDTEKNYWDYQWLLSCWSQNGLTIIPSGNIVSNEGVGGAATHTSEINKFMNMETFAMQFPLKHPPFVIRNRAADLFTQNTNFSVSKNSFKKYYELLKNKLIVKKK